MPRDGTEGDAPRGISLRKRFAFSLIPLTVCLLLLEPGFRLVFWASGSDRSELRRARDYYLGRVQGYLEPWPYVMFRIGKTDYEYYRDEGGFFSTQPVSRLKDPSKIRIAFVGGSTTQSGNTSGYPGSFPFFVENYLRRANVQVEVLNCGVSSWSSAENVIHYLLNIQDYRPDWVVIHHGANDVKAQLYPTFRSDYGHYRKPFVLPSPGPMRRFLVRNSRFYAWLLKKTGQIPQFMVELADHPLPPSTEWTLNPAGIQVFRRNTENLIHLAEACGARVLLSTESHNRRPAPGVESGSGMCVAMEEQNEVIREIARERRLPLVDTETILDFQGAFFTDYVHVTPKGNRLKAKHIAKALLVAGLRETPGFSLKDRFLQRLEP